MPANEVARQAAVQQLGLDRSRPDAELDRLCAFTCHVLRVPVAGKPAAAWPDCSPRHG